MAIASSFNGSVNLNGNEYRISSWDFRYDPICSLKHKTGFSKFEPSESVSNKYKTETDIKYVVPYDTKFLISPMLTEEDRERIIEEAKIKCAVSWLEV